MYAGMAALIFGVGNCFNADLGSRHGITGPWASWPVLIITWVCYHLNEWRKFRNMSAKKYFTKENSAYFEEFKEEYEEVIKDSEAADDVINEGGASLVSGTVTKEEDCEDTECDDVAQVAFNFVQKLTDDGGVV